MNIKNIFLILINNDEYKLINLIPTFKFFVVN